MLASIAEREHYRQKSIIINCLPHSVGADIKPQKMKTLVLNTLGNEYTEQVKTLIKDKVFFPNIILFDQEKKYFSTIALSWSADRLATPVFSISANSSLFLPMTNLRSLPSISASKWKLPL